MWYDRQGFPIPGDLTNGFNWEGSAAKRWAELHTKEYVVVAQDELPDGSQLSTVWLGLDHGWMGRPLFFETMRFAKEREILQVPDLVKGGVREMECTPTLEFPDILSDEPEAVTEQLRYSSEEEASAAHHEILRRLRIKEGH